MIGNDLKYIFAASKYLVNLLNLAALNSKSSTLF